MRNFYWQSTESESSRANALQGLIEKLAREKVDFRLWQKTLHTLATLTRRNFLKNLPKLAPLIIQLGDVEALGETWKAVKDVSKWWK